ncbi:MAG: ABC transporter substrate-binding protein [Promicromonosporaceae bacterium]|nr:ABC transporter substrate-binding protein [Promicromonosporaceae bacterium]
MRAKVAARVAAAVASAMVLVACATPAVDVAPTAPAVTAPGTEPAAPGETVAPAVTQTINVAWEASPNTTNNMTDWGNHTPTQNVIYLTQGPGWAFFDQDLNYVRNTDFGTFSPTDTAFNADGSLTVTYTVNDNVTWSDGVPFDVADMLLWWLGNNTRFNTITEEQYDEQYYTSGDEGYVPLPEGEVYFSAGSAGMTDVPAFPIISDDGRSITFTFENPRADWYFQFSPSTIAAHTLGRLAFGIDDPMAAKQAVITAMGGPDNYRAQTGNEVPTVVTNIGVAGPLTTFVAPNVTELSQLATVFNTAFDFTGLPSDPGTFLSRGPYVMAEILEDQFVRLVRNPYFTAYGDVVGRPIMDEITVRIIPDALAQATALQNGEVDLISPSATQDLIQTLQGISGIEFEGTNESIWEHVTLQMSGGGVFDPAHWGGDEDVARAVRQAFLLTVPRQQIIDLIISQIDPNAQVRNSFTFIPGSPGYDQVTAANDSSFYAVQDLELAYELLADAGLADQLPLPVRVLYAVQNPRRVQQFQLMQAAAPELFTIIDEGDETWGTRMRQNIGSYDVALFAWASTSTAFLNGEANYITGGVNNIGGFSNQTVDDLWLEARQTTDQNRIIEIAGEMENILMNEGFGITIFQHPGVLAWSDSLENASSIPLSPTMFWNFWDWQRTAN